MATLNGRNGHVKIGTYEVAEQGAWTLNLSSDEIDTTVFGDGWGKSDLGMKKWSMEFNGFFDPTDSTGQKILESAWLNGSLVSTIRLYVNNSSYWVPDTTSVTNSGGRVTSYKIDQAKNGVANVSFSLSGSGAITYV